MKSEQHELGKVAIIYRHMLLAEAGHLGGQITYDEAGTGLHIQQSGVSARTYKQWGSVLYNLKHMKIGDLVYVPQVEPLDNAYAVTFAVIDPSKFR